MQYTSKSVHKNKTIKMNSFSKINLQILSSLSGPNSGFCWGLSNIISIKYFDLLSFDEFFRTRKIQHAAFWLMKRRLSKVQNLKIVKYLIKKNDVTNTAGLYRPKVVICMIFIAVFLATPFHYFLKLTTVTFRNSLPLSCV